MIPQKLILVAASREESLILFHQILHRAGYDVVLAATAGEALEQALRHRPALVLVDPELAGGGFELARRLKLDPHTAGAAIVALSDGVGLDRALREAGFCGSVAQRLPLQVLLDSIRRCLEGAAGSSAWPAGPGVASSAA